VTDAAAFALRNRVLLLQKGAVGIDIALAAIPFEERVLARSTTFEFLLGAGIRTCSAEDLIVYKAFADRPRDWVDVEGILLRQQGRLDLELVFFRIDAAFRGEGISGDCVQIELPDRSDTVNLRSCGCARRPRSKSIPKTTDYADKRLKPCNGCTLLGKGRPMIC
jgi:hypothetical protein